jgi:acyl-coenzyme A thioesterase PaaI-like protein
VNLLAPAVGDAFVARGTVKRAGKKITVCAADAFAVRGKEEKLIATMLATIMNLQHHDLHHKGHEGPQR